MSDVIDRAELEIERNVDRQVSAARASIKCRMLKPKGRCHFCDEQVVNQALYCDHDCSMDHEKMLWHKQQRVGV
ncbi:MAG: hypothetical protein ACRDAL_02450 [Plesiomonas shigelloides]